MTAVTHWDTCSIEGGPAHYQCAVARIRELTAQLEAAQSWDGNGATMKPATPVAVDMKAVDHPVHYNSHPSGIEAIVIVQWMPFNPGNAIKYMWRAGIKEGTTAVQDLQKAIRYLEFEIERLSMPAAWSEEPAYDKHPSGIEIGQIKPHMTAWIGVAFWHVWEAQMLPALGRVQRYQQAIMCLRSENARLGGPLKEIGLSR